MVVNHIETIQIGSKSHPKSTLNNVVIYLQPSSMEYLKLIRNGCIGPMTVNFDFRSCATKKKPKIPYSTKCLFSAVAVAVMKREEKAASRSSSITICELKKWRLLLPLRVIKGEEKATDV